MTHRQAYLYKVAAYLGILAVILLALFSLGRPSQLVKSPTTGDILLSEGGVLARYRAKAGLEESQLGEIDPASSTIKFATFGMRGVAIAVLWRRSQEYQKRFDWNNVIATSNQLVLLEPHFTTIWEFLGWNLAYNASSEFDDYRERYRWVIRGVDFLVEGVEKNKKAPKLCKATGWTISQRIGIADENEQFRRMLREDEDFWQRHEALRLPSERDNWILGRRFYHQGEELVDSGVSIGNESDFLFYSYSRLNLFNYASWKHRDGIFGEDARRAWENAGAEWIEFAKKEYGTAIPEDGTLQMRPGVKAKRARMETTDLIAERKKELEAEMDALVPDLKKSLCLARWESLAEVPGQQGTLLESLRQTQDPRMVKNMQHLEELTIIRDWLEENRPDWEKDLEADLDKLYTEEQLALKRIPRLLLEKNESDTIETASNSVSQVRSRALEILKLTPRVLAQEIQDMDDLSTEVKRGARRLAAEEEGFKETTRMSDLFRGILNYEYRLRQVEVETTQQADDARRKRYFARVAYYDNRLRDSVDGWYDAMQSWEDMLNLPGFEDIRYDGQFTRDIMDIVEKLVIILDKVDEIFPVKFPLQDLIRIKIEEERNPKNVFDALEYARKVYEEGDYEKAETYFLKILDQFVSLNMVGDDKYMKLAPLPEYRDGILQSQAMYIRSLRAQGKPLPEPLPLRAYVELMIRHDPEVALATAPTQEAFLLSRDGHTARAEEEAAKSVELWAKLADKYPLIPVDSTLSTHRDLVDVFALYLKALQEQGKPLPDPLPLRKTILEIMADDPRVEAAKTLAKRVLDASATSTSDQAQRNMLLEQAINVWAGLVNRYPIVAMDRELPEHKAIAPLVEMYVGILKSQGDALPEDFPLKDFLPAAEEAPEPETTPASETPVVPETSPAEVEASPETPPAPMPESM